MATPDFTGHTDSISKSVFQLLLILTHGHLQYHNDLYLLHGYIINFWQNSKIQELKDLTLDLIPLMTLDNWLSSPVTH